MLYKEIKAYKKPMSISQRRKQVLFLSHDPITILLQWQGNFGGLLFSPQPLHPFNIWDIVLNHRLLQ